MIGFIVIIIIISILYFVFTRQKNSPQEEGLTTSKALTPKHREDMEKISKGDPNLHAKNPEIVYILLRQKYNLTGKLEDRDFENLEY